ncbi:MAG: HAMP domain-containing histidine kinase [Anaeromyxobacter sp.]|nr:HAMP domain-containing histidine kinase [Anaeromyxobacter sp.]MBL0274582.1 HAMP domain-containing histidine kinase [Anaeromyxobacter sp.]
MAPSLEQVLAEQVRGDAPILYLRLDPSDRIVDSNRHTRGLLGDALHGIRFGDLLVTFERELCVADLVRGPSSGRLVSFLGREGPPFSQRCTFTALSWGAVVLGGGEARGAARLQAATLALNADLTSQARELQQANAQLARLGRLKDQFLGMAAHDLRSPILGVSTFAGFLAEDLGPALGPEQRDHLSIIQNSARLMRRLVDDFLDVALIEAGQLRLALAPARLAEVTDHALRLVDLAARRKRVALRVTHAPGLPLLPLDAERLTQVVVNLATNAVQHSYAGGAVEVETGADAAGQWLRVRDQGTGIPPEVQQDLFAPFTSAAGRKTAGERSTGLGLAITRMIVEGHRGTIEVASALSRGATFTVRLPAPAVAG